MKKMKNMKANFFLIFAFLGLFLSFVVCSVMYIQFSRYVESSYYNTLSRVARMVEGQYPVLKDIDKIKEGYEQDEDWFWDMSRELSNIADVFNIAYIYYIEKVEIGYEFLMSSIVHRDFHPEWLGGPVWTETPTPPTIDEAWNTQRMTYTPEPSVEEWGVLVSAALPVVSNGQTVGILGVDYDISTLNISQRRILIYLIVSFIVSIILTSLLAFFGSKAVLISIAERERTANEANERNKKIESLMGALKSAVASRNTFMASLTNEMSTPIYNIISTSSLMIEDKKISEEDRKNYLEKINDSGTILLNAVNDIIEISKLDSGRMEVRPVQYLLPDMISDMTSLHLNLDNRNISFVLNISDGLPLKLFGDDHRIKSICTRLLYNAFRYSSKGVVTLDVSCSRGDKGYVCLIISVRDTGTGIAKKDLETLLSDYEHINVVNKLRESGTTGLGLYIMRRMTETMKGKFSVASEVGKGSVFSLRLPQKLVSNETISADLKEQLKLFRYSKTHAAADHKTEDRITEDQPIADQVTNDQLEDKNEE